MSFRRKIVIVFLLSCVGSAGVIAWIIRQSTEAQRTTVILGELRDDKVVDAILRIRNWSFRPMEVKRISTTCNCTVVEQPKLPILPFASVEVPVNINPKGKSGTFVSSVAVEFTHHPSHLVEYHANIISANPLKVDLGRFKAGEKVTRTLSITESDIQNLRIDNILVSDPWLLASPAPFSNQGTSARIQIEVSKNVKYGDLTAQLLVSSNSPANSRREISVQGYALKPIELSTPTVSLGYLTPSSNGRGVLKVYTPYANSLELIKVDAEQQLAWHIAPAKEQNNFEIAFELAEPQEKLGIFKISAIAEFRAGSETEITPLEFFGYVLEPAATDLSLPLLQAAPANSI